MHDPTEPVGFPDLPDEAVIAINDFIEDLYVRFQNHYFVQMHRYDQQRRHQHDPCLEQIPLPLKAPPSDPPF